MPAPRTVAQLRIVPTGERWRVSVGDGTSPPVEAECPAGVPILAPPRSPVLIAGSDAAFSRAEDQFAAALAERLAGAGPAWAHLQVLRGRAEASGQPLVVVIDAEPASAPWELLSLGDGPVEVADAGVVVRWAPGAPGPRATRPTGAVWVATDDPASLAVAEAARRSLRAAGLRHVDLDERPSVLWLVAHGARGEHALEVAVGGTGAGPAAVSARLGEALRSATLAVVAVCHGGTPDVGRHDALVGRLLAAGVPVVLAPATAVPAELLIHLADGLGPALARGEPLHRVIAAARRQVRAWAFPQAVARWTAVRCFASSTDALQVVLSPAGWVPDGWPLPDPSAASWLAAARRDAERRADGYVGVEHLLRTLQRLDGGGPVAAAMRRASHAWLAPCEAASAALVPQRHDAGPLGLTPRLARLGPRLTAGFDVEALATQLLGEVSPSAEPVASGQGATLDSVGSAPRPPATALEVVGGPEDGRLLVPSDGDVVGRAGGGATFELYADTRLTDRKLSRQHLTWRGGRLHSVRPLRIGGPDGPRDPAEPLRLGDLVEITAGTRLRAVRHA